MKVCPICKHELNAHYLKPTGKIWWWWTTNKWGKKIRKCSCRACDEYEAEHGTLQLFKNGSF